MRPKKGAEAWYPSDVSGIAFWAKVITEPEPESEETKTCREVLEEPPQAAWKYYEFMPLKVK